MTNDLEGAPQLEGTATTYFGSFGPPSISNGFPAFPIPAGSKKTRWSKWNRWCHRLPNESEISRWSPKCEAWSVAIACGKTVFAVDIDEEDAEQAELMQALTFRFLGPTRFVRIGRAPRRILVYGTSGLAIKTCSWPKVDLLADGRYFVAFGLHPLTEQPYAWPDLSPSTTNATALPTVTAEALDRLLTTLDAMHGRSSAKTVVDTTPVDTLRNSLAPYRTGPWQADRSELVVDGRDAFLAHLVWTAAKRLAMPRAVARAAWAEFERRAELKRPARNGSRPWGMSDALQKANALQRRGTVGRRLQRQAVGEHGFWTGATKHAFGIVTAQHGAAGRLSPAAVAVSDMMLGLVHGDGTCFASVGRLAGELHLSTDTVKKARRVLRDEGLWLADQAFGGKGYVAHYSPHPEALAQRAEHVGWEGPETMSLQHQTVDASDTLIFQWEGGDLWGDLLLPPEEEKSARWVESRNASAEYRENADEVPEMASTKCREHMK